VTRRVILAAAAASSLGMGMGSGAGDDGDRGVGGGALGRCGRRRVSPPLVTDVPSAGRREPGLDSRHAAGLLRRQRGTYLVYAQFERWTYLRFLLPALVVLAAMVGAWEEAEVRRRFAGLDQAVLDWPPRVEGGRVMHTRAWRIGDRRGH